MEMGEILGNMNYLAVLVAALSSFVVGWLWYGPLFGKLWMKLNGFTEENLRQGGLPMPTIMLSNYLATLLASFGIAIFLHEDSGVGFGILLGVIIAVLFIATNRLNDVLYEKKPAGLFLLNAGYALFTFALMGAVLGAWR